jgi:hypothetical protein
MLGTVLGAIYGVSERSPVQVVFMGAYPESDQCASYIVVLYFQSGPWCGLPAPTSLFSSWKLPWSKMGGRSYDLAVAWARNCASAISTFNTKTGL